MNLASIKKAHVNGKLEITPKIKIKKREDLSTIYTPGVAEVCKLIYKNEDKSKEYTISGKTIAIVTDGTAVLGLGDIGAKAALPVMEGKAVIFKEFGGINAFPICLDTKDPDEIIRIVKAISPNFAAINLEDIAAPNCFYIEQTLQKELDKPVMHDDQHGTAIVLLAALMGALTLYPKKSVSVVVTGAGAAGVAVTKLLIKASKEKIINLKEIRNVDSKGLVSSDRKDLNESKIELAKISKQKKSMNLKDAVVGMDVFIGVSGPGILSSKMVSTMNEKPFVFAMANPDPEINPIDAKKGGAVIIGTGRSDYPNQINNALSYPGVFKGLIEGKIKKADDTIKLTAAKAIFNYNRKKLSAKRILPSILDKRVPEIIAREIIKSHKP